MNLTWRWISVPFLACAVVLAGTGVLIALLRGDRVMRLGMIGAAAAALPWAVCTALAACSDDPAAATRLLRLGVGPVALCGPNLLIVLLGITGQLERHRWLARGAAGVSTVMMILCWATPYTVPGVHRLSSGMFFLDAGPLTPFHLSQLAIWTVVGLAIARRSATSAARRRPSHLLVAVLAIGALGSADLLLAYRAFDLFPLAWMAAIVACGVTIYLVLATDVLRGTGIDREIALELAAYAAAAVVIGLLAGVFAGATPLALTLVTSGVFVIAVGIAWGIAARRAAATPPADADALAEIAAIAEIPDETQIAARLRATWARLGLADATIVRAFVAPDVATWLVARAEPLSAGELATMRVGAIRPQLEALFTGDVTLIVPLVDRGTLLGTIRASKSRALADSTRALVAETARTVARGLAFVELARAAAVKNEVAREIDLAQAMHAQSSSARRGDGALVAGRFAIAAEYRSAPRTTGAAWSSAVLADGRLAILVLEAQARGVAAALSTAALTGAFAAATTPARDSAERARQLDAAGLLARVRTSAEAFLEGNAPIAAFVVVVDATAASLAWASAGHPGATVLLAGEARETPLPRAFPSGSQEIRPTVSAVGSGGGRLGTPQAASASGTAKLPPDALIAIASSALRGDDEARWQLRLVELVDAGTGMAATLVDEAAARGELREDLLAVVVRARTGAVG